MENNAMGVGSAPEFAAYAAAQAQAAAAAEYATAQAAAQAQAAAAAEYATAQAAAQVQARADFNREVAALGIVSIVRYLSTNNAKLLKLDDYAITNSEGNVIGDFNPTSKSKVYVEAYGNELKVLRNAKREEVANTLADRFLDRSFDSTARHAVHSVNGRTPSIRYRLGDDVLHVDRLHKSDLLDNIGFNIETAIGREISYQFNRFLRDNLGAEESPNIAAIKDLCFRLVIQKINAAQAGGKRRKTHKRRKSKRKSRRTQHRCRQ